jgi:hypothetical protein
MTKRRPGTEQGRHPPIDSSFDEELTPVPFSVHNVDEWRHERMRAKISQVRALFDEKLNEAKADNGKSVGNIYELISKLDKAIVRLESKVDDLNTRRVEGRGLVLWIVGTMLATAGLIAAIIRLVH